MEYNIKGEIGIWGLPLCKIIVTNAETDNFMEVRAVIDTGAYDYCIKKSVIDFLELPKVGESKLSHPVQGVLNSGIYKARLILEPDMIIEEALCKVLSVDDYPAEVILGTFFLQGKSFNYSTLTGSWRIIF